MSKSKICVATLAAAGAFLLLATSAFGEFESAKTTGLSENIELNLNAGGGKLVCQSFAELDSSILWTIESEGKATTLGPDLLASSGNWGKCSLESSELPNTSATLSNCEIEIRQPAEEISGKLNKTCTVAAGMCEIKLEAKENENLKTLSALSSGEENENLLLVPGVTNIATVISGTCPGVSATKAGILSGAAELKEVKPAVRGAFSVAANPRFYSAAARNGKIRITNKGAAQKPTSSIHGEMPPGSFSSTTAQETTCKTKMYAKGESCEFNIKWELIAGFAFWTFTDANNVSAGGEARAF